MAQSSETPDRSGTVDANLLNPRLTNPWRVAHRSTELVIEGVSTLVTPEAVKLELPTAGLGSRVLSRSIDLCVSIILIVLLALFAGLTGILSTGIGTYIGFGGAAAVFVLYAPVMERLLRGRTLGKLLFGLRVVSADGSPVTFGQSLVRSVVNLFDLVVAMGSLSIVSCMSTARGQTLGDLAGGTVVIREITNKMPISPVVFPLPVGYGDFAAAVDVSHVTDEQYAVVRNFLVRAQRIPPDRRLALGTLIGDALLRITNTNIVEPTNPETFLVCVLHACQRRNGGLAAVGWQHYENAVYVQPEIVAPSPAFSS